ncbi:MAG: hypothetical protein JSV91_01745 [Phycisphaerales bacterium]|nr:MAG: hypothetical protein JSV91_01745 [Phycisphaerales bacterium]
MPAPNSRSESGRAMPIAGGLSSVIMVVVALSAFRGAAAQEAAGFYPGADEATPARSHYFDWINSQYEGSTEEHTLINLDFFKWLHDEYGMALDVYSLDVGNIDDGPYTAGVGRLIPAHYGSLDSIEFRQQFPRGFGPLVERAASFGCRLGIWLGPDGFGETPEQERARTEMLIRLCRDYNFIMFKLDSVAGELPADKQPPLARALKACREICPDLIVLNERIKLGEAEPYATTSLWEGAETYIDVFMFNEQTATHHRAGALARGLMPGLTRRLEDHGVCLSSCLDFWEDDLVFQAFNRSSVISPQIYGNPWFLRDDEFPKLARLFNLAGRYGDVLVSAIALPEERYGASAVSRGSDETRLITVCNLTWNPRKCRIRLDDSIGLARGDSVKVWRFHPSERIIGTFAWGAEVEIEVLPFRSCLVIASTGDIEEIGIHGCDYEIVRDTPNRPVKIKLLGMPGSVADVRLHSGPRHFSRAELDGRPAEALLRGESLQIRFPGRPLQTSWHRRLAVLRPCAVPDDAEALYETTCFAADSNALEVRAVKRSGSSEIPQVIAARDAFFEQPMFINRGIWDRNLFDGDLNTFFTARLEGRSLRVDFGVVIDADTLVIRLRDREQPDLNSSLHSFAKDAVAEISADLRSWTALEPFWGGVGTIAMTELPRNLPIRYLRITGPPRRIAEIEAYRDGQLLDRSAWRASNLFHPYAGRQAVAAWSASFTLDEIADNSKLAVAINGRHGDEGAYAALRVDGELIGAVDRSVSFPSNTWEYYNVEMESDYAYYFPLSPSMRGRTIEIVMLILEGGLNEVKPQVWTTAYPIPFESRELVLFE